MKYLRRRWYRPQTSFWVEFLRRKWPHYDDKEGLQVWHSSWWLLWLLFLRFTFELPGFQVIFQNVLRFLDIVVEFHIIYLRTRSSERFVPWKVSMTTISFTISFTPPSKTFQRSIFQKLILQGQIEGFIKDIRDGRFSQILRNAYIILTYNIPYFGDRGEYGSASSSPKPLLLSPFTVFKFWNILFPLPCLNSLVVPIRL